MELKDFERLLQLKEEKDKNWNEFTKDAEKYDEYLSLKNQLEDFLFDNQSNTERMLTKLKNALSNHKYNLSNYKPNETLNEVKVIREIMDLINRYDWELKYSEYKTEVANGIYQKEVAVWEQNSDGQTRNYKTWIVQECVDRGSTNNIGENVTYNEKFEELQKVSQPLINFLDKYYDPMTTAIVKLDRVDIVRGEMGMPLENK